jgi:hypothetical protein
LRDEITRRTLFQLSASGVPGLAAAPVLKSQQRPKPEIP